MNKHQIKIQTKDGEILLKIDHIDFAWPSVSLSIPLTELIPMAWIIDDGKPSLSIPESALISPEMRKQVMAELDHLAIYRKIMNASKEMMLSADCNVAF